MTSTKHFTHSQDPEWDGVSVETDTAFERMSRFDVVLQLAQRRRRSVFRRFMAGSFLFLILIEIEGCGIGL